MFYLGYKSYIIILDFIPESNYKNVANQKENFCGDAQ